MSGVIRGLASADFEARFRQHQICDHGPLLGLYSTSSQIFNTIKGLTIQQFSIELLRLLKGGVFCLVFLLSSEHRI